MKLQPADIDRNTEGFGGPVNKVIVVSVAQE